MKLLLENWRKHLKEESTLPTEGSAEAAATYYAQVKSYGEIGVELIEGATNDEDATAAAQAEAEKEQAGEDPDYELLKIFKLVRDFAAEAAAPPEEEAQLDDTGDGRIWSYIHGAAPSGDDDGFIPWDEAEKESGFTRKELMDYIDNYASGSEQYYMKYNDDGLDLYDPASV